MSKLLLFILVCSSCNCFEYVFKPGPLIPASKGEVWPKVQFEDKKEEFFTLLTSFFRFRVTGNSCKTLTEALDRYKYLITFNTRLVKQVYFTARPCYESSDPKFLGYLTTLDVELNGSCNDEEYPSFEMKEEYVLNVTYNTRKLSSDTLWGILRGLETFSQLPYLTDDFACHRVNATSIRDFPRFAHRGFLLDTARHYLPKNLILKLLDGLSYNKFNVFHWHIVDDYSFPYVSLNFPELSMKGAFHPTLMVYDQEFVQEVLEYARKRGIRVIPEFDTPGHTLSWGLSHPEVLTKCNNVPLLELGPLDPTKNITYELVFKLFEEIRAVFKDNFTHLGGDEVDFSCWKSNQDVKNFMIEHGMEEDYSALQSYYMQKLIDHVTSLGLSSIVWEEVFTHGVNISRSTIINVWIRDNPKQVMANVTKAGYPAILSSYWYLDQLDTGGDWLKFYNADLLDFPGTDEQKKLVLGGEACMWAEVVDENNLEARVWPRASVAAEKFWSANEGYLSASIPDVWPIASRLEEQTCRMKRRGISAQPPTGPSVCF